MQNLLRAGSNIATNSLEHGYGELTKPIVLPFFVHRVEDFNGCLSMARREEIKASFDHRLGVGVFGNVLDLTANELLEADGCKDNSGLTNDFLLLTRALLSDQPAHECVDKCLHSLSISCQISNKVLDRVFEDKSC